MSSGDVKVSNVSADNAIVESRSSGDVSVDDLISDVVTVRAVSSGDIRVAYSKGRTVQITSGSTSGSQGQGVQSHDY